MAMWDESRWLQSPSYKKKGVVFNHLCLMLKLSCEDPSFACHVLGLFLQIPPGLEHNLFDSIAC